MSLLIIISFSFFSYIAETNAQITPSTRFENNLEHSNTTLYIFTGSDWCADCRRLEKNVLADSAFTNEMQRNNIDIEIIDFPQRKKLPPETVKRNESIAETYDFKGIFPTLILSQSEHNYEVLKYKNQLAFEFSELVVEKLKDLNE